MSIIPGIETRAPERTETSSGFFGVAELAPEGFLDARHAFGDAGFEPLGILVAVIVEIVADPGRYREAGRHRQLERRHLGQVRALAAQKVAHVGAPFGDSRTEKIDLRMSTHVSLSPNFPSGFALLRLGSGYAAALAARAPFGLNFVGAAERR